MSAVARTGRALREKPWLWLLPLIIIVGIFYLYPVLDVIRLSFTNAHLLRPQYIYTLRTYERLFVSPGFMHMMRVTFIFVFASVVFQLLLGLVIALAVQAGIKRGLRGTVLTRTVVLVSWVIPGIVIGLIWRLLLSTSSFGIINYILYLIGLERVPFLYVPGLALFSVTLANIWRGTAFSMLLQYAGLQRIPEEFYEAATVDGAGTWQQFRFITMPQLRPILFLNLVLITIYTFNTFDMIMSLTMGGPGRSTEVISLYAYTTIWRQLNLSGGAAIAVFLLAINVITTLVYYLLHRIGAEQEVE